MREIPMKLIYRFATLTLMFCAVSGNSFAVNNNNLVRGVIGPPGSNSEWSSYSVIDIIPGSALFSFTSSTTVLYLGFTGGTEADIGNMVMYTTPRGSLAITAVTPVTYHGISHPSLDIGSTTVCPTTPSSATPCIIRLDPISLTLSPSSDYYFVFHFTTDTNNQTISGTQPTASQTSLGGIYVGGTDETQLTVGQSIPFVPNQGPSFLLYVMNN
jgi:hypothetical protein